MSNKMRTLKGGKVLLDFKLLQFPDGLRDEASGEQTTPPHWRLQDPQGGVICYGYMPTFNAMVSLMHLAKLGAKHGTQQEFVAAGIRLTPRIWTPESEGAPEPGEVGSKEWWDAAEQADKTNGGLHVQ
jgi:hypothetical protein